MRTLSHKLSLYERLAKSLIDERLNLAHNTIFRIAFRFKAGNILNRRISIGHRIAVIDRLQHFLVIHIVAKSSTFLWCKTQTFLELPDSHSLIGAFVGDIDPVGTGQYNLHRCSMRFHKRVYLRIGIAGSSEERYLDGVIRNVFKTIHQFYGAEVLLQFSHIALGLFLLQQIGFFFAAEYIVDTIRLIHAVQKIHGTLPLDHIRE